MSERESRLGEFIEEMARFAKTAEETLNKIQADSEANRGLFSVFSERMFTIRGTALQLSLPQIAQIAGLGEEIASRASEPAATRAHIRKAVGSLWDSLTSVKYMLEHPDETGIDDILLNRLEATLKSLGGRHETVGDAEIEAMLKARDQG